jgi:SAM-dependent methyltransferase
LIDEARQAPIIGWNFDWLQRRAREDRPTWHYSERARRALAEASSALDIDTGGGEVLAFIGQFPVRMVATEAWPPNVPVARARLEPLGAHVVQTDTTLVLPFDAESFDLALNRHGLPGRSAASDANRWWSEVARVLRPNGRFLSQQVGGRGMQELRKAMGIPRLGSLSPWDAELARTVIARSGLIVNESREEFPKTTFFDVGAVAYYLRMVIWIVPGFSVETHLPHLREIHERIQREGPFETRAHRILIDARKPQ